MHSSSGSGGGGGGEKLPAIRLINFEQCSADSTPNVLILSGFPWHASETAVHHYLMRVYPHAEPTTTRLYTCLANGSSRGICFVEYPTTASGGGGGPKAMTSSSTAHARSTVDLSQVKQCVESTPFEPCSKVSAQLYVLTSAHARWDREGQLPPLPTDPAPTSKALFGYGDEGFAVKCGPTLGLANTVAEDGAERLRTLRKRMRKIHSRSSSSSS